MLHLQIAGPACQYKADDVIPAQSGPWIVPCLMAFCHLKLFLVYWPLLGRKTPGTCQIFNPHAARPRPRTAHQPTPTYGLGGEHEGVATGSEALQTAEARQLTGQNGQVVVAQLQVCQSMLQLAWGMKHIMQGKGGDNGLTTAAQCSSTYAADMPHA